MKTAMATSSLIVLISTKAEAATKGSALVDLLLNMTLLGSEWVLWILIILSIWSVAIMLDRYKYFKNDHIEFEPLMAKIATQISGRNFSDASRELSEINGYEKRIIEEAIGSSALGSEAVSKGVASLASIEKVKMEKGLNFLATLGNNAPFIGLFGTVLGIIMAFKDLADNPAGGPQVVMAGISEALVATAVGLFVAIPAVVAYNFFTAKIEEKMTNADAARDLILKHMSEGKS